MNDKAVAEYLKAERSLKRKLEEIKWGKYAANMAGAELFGPLITPLHDISSNIKKSATDTPILPNIEVDELKRKFAVQAGNTDNSYGLYSNKGQMCIGCKDVEIKGDNLIFDGGKKYHLTEGLWALLTRAQPENYSSEDLQHYGEIVRDTYTYKIRNDPESERVKANGGHKYKNIIKPILYKYNLLQGKSRKVKGEGLTKIVDTTPRNTEYVYWNSLDELLERLTVLYGEVKAGNSNNHIRNEIVSIIQELKEV